MVTQALLKELFIYNPDTGLFIRRKQVRGPNGRIGNIAGHKDKSNGYVKIGVNGKSYKAHRLVWLYMYGKFPSNQLDHINHNRSDNRLSNLREVSMAENLKNKKFYSCSKHGFNGVIFQPTRNTWYARISVNGKLIHIGRYRTFYAACYAGHSANIKYGFHQNHGK